MIIPRVFTKFGKLLTQSKSFISHVPILAPPHHGSASTRDYDTSQTVCNSLLPVNSSFDERYEYLNTDCKIMSAIRKNGVFFEKRNYVKTFTSTHNYYSTSMLRNEDLERILDESVNNSDDDDNNNKSNNDDEDDSSKKRKWFRVYVVRNLRNAIIAVIVMWTSVKLFHKFRLYDSRNRFSSKTLTKIIQIFEAQFRLNYCVGFFFYHVGRLMFWYKYYEKVLKLNEDEIDERVNVLHDDISKKLLRLLLKLGGMFIKFGQEVSMVPMLPPIYHERLALLHDSVPPLTWEDIKGLIYEELGEDIDNIFEIKEKDKIPVAAASLAQVYKWKLKKTGETVAVKVQYPLAQYYISGDINIQILSMWLGSKFDKKYKQSYEGFKGNFDLFKAELDFLNEGKNQEKCRKMFENSKYISAPKVNKELSTGRLITMEWVDGVKPTNVKAIKELGFTKKQVAEKIFEAFGKMIFEHGFIHGDLHAGNMFICKDKINPKEPKLMILDHGLYSTFPKKFRIDYAKFWKALILNDKKFLQEYTNSFGITNYRYFVMINTLQQYDGVLKDDMMEGNGKFQIPDKWVDDMKKMDSKKEKEIEDLMLKLPQELLFVTRSSFILGFINSKLGAPINRFSLMARIAHRNCQGNANGLKKIFDTLKFEMNLRTKEVKSTILTWLLNLYLWYQGKKTGTKGEQTIELSLNSLEKKFEM